MTGHGLVCARCAHPVVEGRCASCRSLRERSEGPSAALLVVLLALGLLLAALAVAAVPH